MAGDFDGGREHGEGADPPAAFAVEGLIDDERFFGFGVTGDGEDEVVVALVVAIAAGAELGG